jgi:predicted neutral ceramidase superfamily lipid hydrolase
MGILVFLIVATTVALVSHRWIRPFLLALLISGPVAACVFQIIVTMQLGHLDPFFLIALATTTLFGWAIALFVGLVMRYAAFDPVPKEGGTTPQAQDGLDPIP